MSVKKRLHQVAQPIFASEVYITCGDDLLMFERSQKKKNFPGFCSVPGGHIDQGEDPLKAAIREVKEETGIKINPSNIQLKAIALHHHIDRKELFAAFLFLTEIEKKVTPKQNNKEGIAYWVPKKEAFTKPNVFPPIRYYFDHVLNNKPGVIYNMSEWKDSKLVKVLSETLDRNY